MSAAKKIRTIALDDEPLALKLVSDYVRKTPFLELAGAFDNPLDAVDFLSDSKVDLILLDVQMPDLTGVDFAKTLQPGTKIIFTTAYEKYAIEGFKLNAIDYLLKPFSYQEFLTAVNKVKHLIELEEQAYPSVEANNEFLFLKSEYKIRRINFHEILYIEGMKDYVKVYLQNETKPVLSLNSVKSLEEKLPAEHFMRVHRSYIVNLDKVETVERSHVVFGKKYIPVSDQYKARFQDFLKRNFL